MKWGAMSRVLHCTIGKPDSLQGWGTGGKGVLPPWSLQLTLQPHPLGILQGQAEEQHVSGHSFQIILQHVELGGRAGGAALRFVSLTPRRLGGVGDRGPLLLRDPGVLYTNASRPPPPHTHFKHQGLGSQDPPPQHDSGHPVLTPLSPT